METEFTMSVPSNSSMDMFPRNTLADFTAHFKAPLELGSSYEVGLCGIQYTKSWNNVRKGSNIFHIRIKYPKIKALVIKRKVPIGYYATVPELIKAIMKKADTSNKSGLLPVKGLKMSYNESTKQVRISTEEMEVEGYNGQTPTHRSIILRGDIARLLGFQNNIAIKGKGAISRFAATPSGGFRQMYLYADIIYPQRHPDGDVKLLRIIPIEDKPNQSNVALSFSPVYYKSIMKHRIDTMHFTLTDDTGKLVGFEYGKVVIELSFRKKL